MSELVSCLLSSDKIVIRGSQHDGICDTNFSTPIERRVNDFNYLSSNPLTRFN